MAADKSKVVCHNVLQALRDMFLAQVRGYGTLDALSASLQNSEKGGCLL